MPMQYKLFSEAVIIEKKKLVEKILIFHVFAPKH